MKEKKAISEIAFATRRTSYGKFIFGSPRSDASFKLFVRIGHELTFDPPLAPPAEIGRRFTRVPKVGSPLEVNLGICAPSWTGKSMHTFEYTQYDELVLDGETVYNVPATVRVGRPKYIIFWTYRTETQQLSITRNPDPIVTYRKPRPPVEKRRTPDAAEMWPRRLEKEKKQTLHVDLAELPEAIGQIAGFMLSVTEKQNLYDKVDFWQTGKLGKAVDALKALSFLYVSYIRAPRDSKIIKEIKELAGKASWGHWERMEKKRMSREEFVEEVLKKGEEGVKAFRTYNPHEAAAWTTYVYRGLYYEAWDIQKRELRRTSGMRSVDEKRQEESAGRDSDSYEQVHKEEDRPVEQKQDGGIDWTLEKEEQLRELLAQKGYHSNRIDNTVAVLRLQLEGEEKKAEIAAELGICRKTVFNCRQVLRQHRIEIKGILFDD